MMTDLPYLLRLGTRLSSGLASLPEERRTRHADFILKHQQNDGGFRGREGDADLYYTSFAIRTLQMIDRLPTDVVQYVSEYLSKQDPLKLNVIDLMNWLSTALAVQLAGGPDLIAGKSEDFLSDVTKKLEAVRTEDGGYAKSEEGAAGSTYHSFLVMLTYQLLGSSLPRPNALIQFLYDRQRDDGGFVEIAPMRRSGTNPSAAAAAILNEFNAVDDETTRDLAGFLREVRSSEGGFQANTRIPFADSLSTFTAILTAQDLGLSNVFDAVQVRNWVTSQLEFPTGGFRAAAWDDAADVEYTFYSLGVLALIGS